MAKTRAALGTRTRSRRQDPELDEQDGDEQGRDRDSEDRDEPAAAPRRLFQAIDVDGGGFIDDDEKPVPAFH
jgi:hypothetical protein